MILFPQDPPQPRQTLPDTAWGMPPQVSTFAEDVDGLYQFVTWVSIFFFVLITAILVYSLFKWRRRSEDQVAASNETHNTPLEVTWTVIPLIIVMIIFAWGWRGSLDMTVAPPDALSYQVKARKWEWAITHPNHSEPLINTIYVPVGRPVKFITQSEDVLHSFFVPAMRVKRDVLPGRLQMVWFQAEKTGTFPLFCTEYCGDRHSFMIGEVHVVGGEEYDAAVKNLDYGPKLSANATPAEKGEYYYKNRTCMACHSVNGTRIVGPTFKGLWGKEERLQGGATVTVDEAYITESIKNPMAKIVEGYPPSMPPQQVTDEEIGFIIEYIKSLK
ncbi:MAG: cytochrome c oxidase subunit II [Planctomycetota bacterium]